MGRLVPEGGWRSWLEEQLVSMEERLLRETSFPLMAVLLVAVFLLAVGVWLVEKKSRSTSGEGGQLAQQLEQDHLLDVH